MAKKSVSVLAGERAQSLAQALGYDFVDVELVRENGVAFLRIFIDIDKEGGMTLEDCSVFHHAFMEHVQDLEYDYLEISSPGVDRPLKRPRDYEKAVGEWVEVKLYRALQGRKLFRGKLIRFDEQQIFLAAQEGEICLERSQCALVKLLVEYVDIEEE